LKPLRLATLAALAFMLGDTPEPQGAKPASDPLAGLGAVLFRDAFSDSLGPEWTFDQPGVWRISEGHLRAELPDEKQMRSFAYAGSERWKDYAVDFDICGLRGVDKGVVVRVDGEKRGVGFDLRGPQYNDLVMYRGYESWARVPVPNVNGKWYHVRIELKKNRYRAYVNGERQIDFTDEANSRPKGRIALAAYTGGTGACVVLFDNVEVRAVK
jgi:hypothetical protein